MDHLTTPHTNADLSQWTAKGEDLFTDLLYEIGGHLGFRFDKVELKKSLYYPQAHENEFRFQMVLRAWAVSVMTGKTALPIKIVEEQKGASLEAGKPGGQT